MIKLFRITTVPISLQKLIVGQLPFMQSKGIDPIMISSYGPEVPLVVKEQNCNHIAIAMTRKITPFKDLIALWRFYSLCRLHRPLIVHSHTPKAGIIGMLGSRLAGIPIRLHTVAGMPLLEETGFKRTILKLVEKLTYACATKVYPNSILLSHFIISNNLCCPNKVKVIGNGSSNGIDTVYYSKDAVKANSIEDLRRSLNIEQDDFVFIFIGRIVRDKGVVELVSAFKTIQAQVQRVKLILVGPLEQDLDPLPERILNEIESNPSITLTGYKNDIRPYLAISDLLVFPSYREGFPNVPLQAGCFDLPSIVTDINGCNEIIENEKNGLIIPVKNEGALKEAMLRLLNDKNLYKELQSNARAMIVERFNQQYFWDLLYREYKTQINKHESTIS